MVKKKNIFIGEAAVRLAFGRERPNCGTENARKQEDNGMMMGKIGPHKVTISKKRFEIRKGKARIEWWYYQDSLRGRFYEEPKK